MANESEITGYKESYLERSILNRAICLCGSLSASRARQAGARRQERYRKSSIFNFHKPLCPFSLSPRGTQSNRHFRILLGYSRKFLYQQGVHI